MSELGDILRHRAEARKAAMAQNGTRRISWIDKQPVRESDELARIAALPRRSYTPADIESFVLKYTERYSRPNGTMTLRPNQALAIHELETYGVLFGAIPVGGGKTIISLLAPTVLGARTAVLLVPASLQSKLFDLEYPELVKHWRLPSLAGRYVSPGSEGVLHVVTYNRLSSTKTVNLLETLRPDVVIGDEAHTLANASARTRKFKRFFKAFPSSQFCPISGSFLALADITPPAGLAGLALGDGSPWPRDWVVLQEWAAAINPGPIRAPPGALTRALGARPGEDLVDAFRRRIEETPGVVACPSGFGCEASLNVYSRKVSVPSTVAKALQGLRDTWCTPSGYEIRDALEFSRIARQMAAGFYYKPIYPHNEPLEERKEHWEAKAEWHREVRDFLQSRARPGMDSPGQLEEAARGGVWKSETYERWAAIKGRVRPSKEAVWVDDFLVDDAVEWAREDVGVVWYEHRAVGIRIAEKGDLPRFGQGPDAASAIVRESGKRSVVASRRAHFEGRNLQMFRRCAYTTPSSNPKVWTQSLGRFFRPGQTAEEVEAHVYLHTPETRAAFDAAVDRSKFVERLTPGQLLTVATYVL